jgi:hypothetical protein
MLRADHRACQLPPSFEAPAAILYFVDARHFTPRGRGANPYSGGTLEAVRAQARALGLTRERREGAALLLTE